MTGARYLPPDPRTPWATTGAAIELADRRSQLKASEGHQLLVVMNGSRLLDTLGKHGWESRHVGAQGAIPKGVYDLTRAEKPALNVTSKAYEGFVLHVGDKHVFQACSSGVVKHDRALFRVQGQPAMPAVGSRLTMTYERGQGRVVGMQQSQERSW